MKTCFNCGKKISRKDGNETVEHIPIQSLFAGFGEKYKVNRITVPCCCDCNNESSKIADEEFRNFIGSISNQDDLQVITDKAIKSILHYRKQYKRIYISENGIPGLLSRPKHIVDYLTKVFKGIFHHQYGIALPAEYIIKVDFDKSRHGEISQPYINYLLSNFDYKYSGSPYIFKFILQPDRKNFSQTVKVDIIPVSEEN